MACLAISSFQLVKSAQNTFRGYSKHMKFVNIFQNIFVTGKPLPLTKTFWNVSNKIQIIRENLVQLKYLFW